MKQLLLTTLALSSFSALAAPNVDVTAGLVTEYLNQGYTQTMNDPTAQLEVVVSEGNWYAGAWASGVDFGDGQDGAEVDVFGGYVFDLGSDYALDVGFIHYTFNGFDGASDANYTDAVAIVSKDAWQAGVKVSPDFLGTSVTNVILLGSYTFELPVGSLEVGGDWSWSSDESKVGYNSQDNYIHWNVTYAYPLADSWEVTVSYDGTNVDDDPDGFADDRLSAGVWFTF